MNEKEDRAKRRLRALRRCRRILEGASLALTTGFFMPLFMNLVPARYLWQSIGLPDAVEFPSLMNRLLTYACAYTFGLFVFVGSIGRKSPHDAPCAKPVTMVFYGVYLGSLLYQSLWNWVWVSGGPWLFVRVLVVVAACVVFMGEWLFRRSGLLCTTWYITLILIVWFAGLIHLCLFMGGSIVTYYGSWVGLFAALVMCGAVWAEAMIRTRTKLLRTLLNIATCRLRLLDPAQPCCADCGYLLIGLPSSRCPECGLEFDPAEHELVAENPVLHSTTSEDH